jgi:hypothetical protein
VVLDADIPGQPLGAAVPLLGALYTAATPPLPAAPLSARGGRGSVTGTTGAAAAAATAAGWSEPELLAASDGTVVFRKEQIDFAAKDRKHKKWPANLALTLRFRAVGLPAVYFAALREHQQHRDQQEHVTPAES